MFARENLFLIELNGTLVFLATDPRNDGYTGEVTVGVALDDRTDDENLHRWLLDDQPRRILGRAFHDERQFCVFGFPEQIRNSLYEEVGQPFLEVRTLAEAHERLGLPTAPVAPPQHKRRWGCGIIALLLLATGCLLLF
jgi:hypothetical protein